MSNIDPGLLRVYKTCTVDILVVYCMGKGKIADTFEGHPNVCTVARDW